MTLADLSQSRLLSTLHALNNLKNGVANILFFIALFA